MASQTYYQIFDISKDATAEEIKQAYRRLAFKYHPDTNKGDKLAEQKMKEINFIYSILSDDHKRKGYDETLAAKSYFDNFDFGYEARKSWLNIYCDELEVTDLTGRKIKIRVGQRIFYPAEIDKTIITWKRKNKEYIDIYISKIFNPNLRDSFHKVLDYSFIREPLCLAHFGGQEIIIYKEDFNSFWLSEESYRNIDMKKGLITATVVALSLIIGIYYLFATHPITSAQKSEIKNSISKNEIDIKYREFLSSEFKATKGEINYIESGRYEICSHQKTKTVERVEVRSAPDSFALSTGELPKATEVETLLFYPDHDAYKVTSGKVTGWIPARFLDLSNLQTDRD